MASIYSCSISDVIRKQGKSMLLWASSDPTRIILPPSWGCFRCTRPLTLGSVRAGTLSYSVVQLFSKYSNLCANHTDGQTARNLITALCVASRGNKRYISALYLIFLATTPKAYILQPITEVYLRWNFYGELRNFCLFRRAGRFGRSRSSKAQGR